MNGYKFNSIYEDYASLDGYEIDLAAQTVRIIVENGQYTIHRQEVVSESLVALHDLQWRRLKNGSICLTLQEIIEQLNPKGVVYVWVDSPLRGEIFMYDGRWQEHGDTKGYA